MLKILISKKLANILSSGMAKTAADDDNWDSKSYDEQVEYLKRHPKSKKKVTKSPSHQKSQPNESIDSNAKNEYGSMSIPEIQSTIKSFQSTGSTKDFKKLYLNFSPLIVSTVRRVVGSRSISKDDLEDLRQHANIIFAKAIVTADSTNQGIIKYIQTTLYRQLIGKSREIFRQTVTIGPKDRKALRAIQRYIHDYYSKHGEMPTDYEKMAYEISQDPRSDSSHLTADLIRDLLQSGSVSMNEELGGDEDGGRKREDVLGQSDVESEFSEGITSPEQDAINTEFNETIRKNIDVIDDPDQKRVLELYHGFDKDHPETEENFNEIAKILNKPRKTVKRMYDRAIATLRSMKEIQKLKNAKQIFRIMKAFDKHIRFAYVPASMTKIGSTTIIDQFAIKKIGQQLICSCGIQNCLHKEYVKSHN